MSPESLSGSSLLLPRRWDPARWWLYLIYFSIPTRTEYNMLHNVCIQSNFLLCRTELKNKMWQRKHPEAWDLHQSPKWPEEFNEKSNTGFPQDLLTCLFLWSKMLTYLLLREMDSAQRKRIILEPVVFKLKPSMVFKDKSGISPTVEHVWKACIAVPDRKRFIP